MLLIQFLFLSTTSAWHYSWEAECGPHFILLHEW